MDTDFEWAPRLAVALAIGLLVGLERGWKRREADEGERELGLRTLGLIGLVGGLSGVLANEFGGLQIGLLFVATAILLASGYVVAVRARGDLGLTTEVAGLATFLLAVLAGMGHLEIAAAGAVVMVLLLSYKQQLHGWLRALNRPELLAAFKLLLISVVLLPVLPDRGYGPWQALNPYVIWWMVVLIAAISFAGYFAIRIVGARGGTVFTALFGGLASSTVTTMNLARLAQRGGSEQLLAGGILLACGTMFPRMLLVAALIHAPLFSVLLAPTAIMATAAYGPAIWMLRTPGSGAAGHYLLPHNPLELKPALLFGALLAVVMLLGQALKAWFGEAGVYTLAAASGLADVDAVTLSLARMGGEGLAPEIAVLGIIIAASVNSLVKGAIALAVGGKRLGRIVLIPLAIASSAGLAWAMLATAPWQA